MVASVLDGKSCSAAVESSLVPRINDCVSAGIIPHLAVVIVGDDPASHVYVGAKIRACKRLGIKSSHIELPESTSEAEIRKIITELNHDTDCLLYTSPSPRDRG